MSINQTVAERQSPSSERTHEDAAGASSTVTDVEEYARALVRERPVAAVLAAVGLGYLVARLVSRTVR